jgi:hypothetical protein
MNGVAAKVAEKVGALSVAVLVVPTPTRSVGCFDLQHFVDHSHRVHNQRIVGSPHSISNKFQESAVNNLASRESAWLTSCSVANVDLGGGRIFGARWIR